MAWFNMKMSRRKFLKLAGSTVAIVVVGGAVWRALSNGVFSSGQGPAYESWKNWKRESEEGAGPLSLVPSAILAANAHNTQPWLFLVNSDRIDLFVDTKRNTGTLDPYLREMYVSLGCALENLVLAAEAKRYTYNLKLMPNPTIKTHVATISLIPNRKIKSNNSRSRNDNAITISSTSSDSLLLYNSIPQRHTNRGPYDKTKHVTQDVLQSLGSLSKTISPEGVVTIFWFTNDNQRRKVGDLIVQATQAIIDDKQQSDDDFRWFRLSWQDIQNYKDGLTVDASGLPWYIQVFAKILPPISKEQSDSSWLQSTKETHVATAAAFGIIVVHDVLDNIQRLQGGTFFQMIHL